MARVICTLENASTNINGVSFTADRGQMISGEVDDAAAAAFCAIPGYVLVKEKAAKADPAPDDDATKAKSAETKGK